MKPLPPGSTIGILGGGQLGRMMAMAAAELGYHVHIYCPEKNCPAAEVAHQTTTADYEDEAALKAFAATVQVVTYEFENIPIAPVRWLAAWVPVRPGPQLLATTQHRVIEKQAVGQLGIKTAPFTAVRSLEELQAAAKQQGLPGVLKTCRMGYDGKGQVMLDAKSDLAKAWRQLNTDDAILEGLVKFHMEISVIVARDTAGNIESYVPVQNIHEHHILAQTIAPAPISATLHRKASTIAHTIAQGLDLCGLLAIEMFVTTDDEILVNELAPRPHNSGHWTMDACITSQFTQVIRAVVGLPLGNPAALCNARMLNLIGKQVDDWKKHAGNPNAKLHLYGKSETRPGRKMGHVTELTLPSQKG